MKQDLVCLPIWQVYLNLGRRLSDKWIFWDIWNQMHVLIFYIICKVERHLSFVGQSFKLIMYTLTSLFPNEHFPYYIYIYIYIISEKEKKKKKGWASSLLEWFDWKYDEKWV